MTIPEPVPPPPPLRLTLIETTLGRILAATAATDPAWRCTAACDGTLTAPMRTDCGAAAAALLLSPWWTISPPIVPPSSAATAATSTRTDHRGGDSRQPPLS